MLRRFLGKLPNPIFPFALYGEFVTLYQTVAEEHRAIQLRTLIAQLPGPNQALLKELFDTLHMIWLHRENNKETSESLSGFFSSVLFRPFKPTAATAQHALPLRTLVASLIEEPHRYFQMDGYQTMTAFTPSYEMFDDSDADEPVEAPTRQPPLSQPVAHGGHAPLSHSNVQSLYDSGAEQGGARRARRLSGSPVREALNEAAPRPNSRTSCHTHDSESRECSTRASTPIADIEGAGASTSFFGGRRGPEPQDRAVHASPPSSIRSLPAVVGLQRQPSPPMVGAAMEDVFAMKELIRILAESHSKMQVEIQELRKQVKEEAHVQVSERKNMLSEIQTAGEQLREEMAGELVDICLSSDRFKAIVVDSMAPTVRSLSSELSSLEDKVDALAHHSKPPSRPTSRPQTPTRGVSPAGHAASKDEAPSARPTGSSARPTAATDDVRAALDKLSKRDVVLQEQCKILAQSIQEEAKDRHSAIESMQEQISRIGAADATKEPAPGRRPTTPTALPPSPVQERIVRECVDRVLGHELGAQAIQERLAAVKAELIRDLSSEARPRESSVPPADEGSDGTESELTDLNALCSDDAKPKSRPASPAPKRGSDIDRLARDVGGAMAAINELSEAQLRLAASAGESASWRERLEGKVGEISAKAQASDAQMTAVAKQLDITKNLAAELPALDATLDQLRQDHSQLQLLVAEQQAKSEQRAREASEGTSKAIQDLRNGREWCNSADVIETIKEYSIHTIMPKLKQQDSLLEQEVSAMHRRLQSSIDDDLRIRFDSELSPIRKDIQIFIDQINRQVLPTVELSQTCAAETEQLRGMVRELNEKQEAVLAQSRGWTDKLSYLHKTVVTLSSELGETATKLQGVIETHEDCEAVVAKGQDEWVTAAQVESSLDGWMSHRVKPALQQLGSDLQQQLESARQDGRDAQQCVAQLSQTIEQQRQAIEQQRPPPASAPPTGHASQNDVQDVQERLSVLEQRVGSAESPVKHASRHDLLDVQERLSVLEQRGGSAESPAKQQRQQVVLREIEEAQQESRLWISTTGSRMEKDVRELASTVEQDGATKEELRSLRGDVAKLVAVETSGRQALSESLAQLQARQGGDGGGVSKRELSSVRAELLRLFAELETQCAGLSGELERVLQQRDGDGPSKLEASALRAELAERPTRDMVDEQIAHEVCSCGPI